MDNVTASIIIACQTAGAVNSISKLGFALSMLGRQAIAFGQESIQVFSDLQEETQKFGTVFAGVQNQANESIKDLMENYGQSELSARRMMAQVGDLLKGTGMSQQDIAAISGEVSKLGSDLTSFANYSQGAEQATFALVKAMLGETEMAKSLGVFIKTDTEEFKKLEKQARTSGIYIEQFGQTFKASTTVRWKNRQEPLGFTSNSSGRLSRRQQQFRLVHTLRLQQCSIKKGTYSEIFLGTLIQSQINLEFWKTILPS